jgi:Ca2+-binding EF-hand superfamily protein
MTKDVHYYTLDEDGNSECSTPNDEAYIDDNDLRDLLIDLLGDSVSDDEIQKILNAASNEDMSEEEFDKLVDEFILKNKN